MKVADVSAGGRLIAAGDPELRPAISIVTPTYRREAEGLLRACLQSAMEQTFGDYEHIVIDDGSDDETEAVVRAYAACDERVVYVRHDRNSGLPAVRTNEGVLRARGQAVAFLFDDNLFAPDFLERAWAALCAGGADIVHARVAFPLATGDTAELGGLETTRERLRTLNTLANGGVLVRRSLFERIGLYDPHLALRRVCDWDLWLRALALGARFERLPFVGGTERGMVSAQSLGATVAADWKAALAWIQDQDRAADRAARLRPGAIDSYDVLDPAAIEPYLRDTAERREAEALIWAPFLERRPEARPEPTPPPADEVGGFRALVVSNLSGSTAGAWTRTLRDVSGAVVVERPEWQIEVLPPGSVDLIVLIDAGLPYIGDTLDAHGAAGALVIYVLEHGASLEERSLDPGLASDDAELRRRLGGGPIYFPRPGRGFDPGPAWGARHLLGSCDLLIATRDDAATVGMIDREAVRLEPVDGESWLFAPVLGRAARLRRAVAAEAARPFRVALFLPTGRETDADRWARGLGGRLARLGVSILPFAPERLEIEGDAAEEPSAPYLIGSTESWGEAERVFMAARLRSFLATVQVDAAICVSGTGPFAAAGLDLPLVAALPHDSPDDGWRTAGAAAVLRQADDDAALLDALVEAATAQPSR